MLPLINKIVRRARKPFKSGPYTCPVCERTNIGFDPLPMDYFGDLQRYGFIHNIFLSETLNLQNYSCKNCFASDRERLMALYLKEYFKNKPSLSLLNIAPGVAFRRFFKRYPQVNYRTMDLSMKHVDDNLDITNMHSYKDGQFDFFICSHVLEHVPDDKKAMKELYRILKSGGKGIVLVPIILGMNSSLEGDLSADIPTRWKLYGQDDHVRMYAKNDFIDRLQSAGFKIDQLGVNHFGAETFEKTGILPASILYVVSK